MASPSGLLAFALDSDPEDGSEASLREMVSDVGPEISPAPETVLALEEKTKPVRKRAPRKPKTGASKGLRVRIYPTLEQAQDLRRWAGSARWVWNWALGQQFAAYEATGKQPSVDALSRSLTALMKSDPEKA